LKNKGEKEEEKYRMHEEEKARKKEMKKLLTQEEQERYDAEKAQRRLAKEARNAEELRLVHLQMEEEQRIRQVAYQKKIRQRKEGS